MPAGEAASWRLFLAVGLPEDVRAQLEGPRRALDRLSDSVRTSSPESIHLTLHFLGQVEAGSTGPLSEGLRPAIETIPRFSLEVSGVGTFPSPARPSVIWAGVGGPGLDRMRSLHAAIGAVLTRAGVEVERRTYAPHLTLGRLRRPPKAAERVTLRQWLDEWKAVSFGKVGVDEVRLIRSQLGGGPPRYTTLTTFPLQ